MGKELVNFIYLSDLLNLPVINVQDNNKIGRIVDLAANTAGLIYPKITGIIIKNTGKKDETYISWNRIKNILPKQYVALDYLPESIDGNSNLKENEILLKKTFLDKQIISTSGNKVVRVNDLHLLIDNSTKENSNIWVVHIDIGIKGLLRRLGWVNFLNSIFNWMISRDIKDKFVSWKYVQPMATANVQGALHLKLDSSKLSEIHPADLADIIEDLGIDERISLIESLDNITAAATMQEISLKIRVQLAETLDAAKLAGIINNMQMDEAVDLLDELSPEHRNALLNILPPEKVPELKELSKLSIYSVGSIMNTDFVVAKDSQTVQEILEMIKIECRKAELIYYVYIVDGKNQLRGIISLRNLLSSDPATLVSDIMTENIIYVKIDTNIKRVAQMFFKYNFEAIPVVDDDKTIQGIITLRDALESVFPEMKQENKT